MRWYAKRFVYLCIFALSLVATITGCSTFRMPKESYTQTPPALSAHEEKTKTELYQHVYALSEDIGEHIK